MKSPICCQQAVPSAPSPNACPLGHRHVQLLCRIRLRVVVLLLFLVVAGSQSANAQQKAEATPPDFNREVQPILSKHCYACHGMDDKTREADLRLDTLDGSRQAIEPGDPEASEVWAKNQFLNKIYSQSSPMPYLCADLA